MATDTTVPSTTDPSTTAPINPIKTALPETPAEAVIKVDIEASPEDVWDKLTSNDGFASWIGEGSTIGDKCGDELHVHDIATGQQRRGVLDEVTPARRLGYTWWPETKPDQATRVAISLDPHPGGTRVTVIESRPLMARNGAPQASMMAITSASSAAWMWRSTLLTVAVRWNQSAGSPGVAALVG